MSSAPAALGSQVTPTPVVRIVDLRLRLGGVSILEGANLECHAGERVALLGNNGTGKSTLLRLLTGQLRADRGSIEILGLKLGGRGRDPRQLLGYVPDTTEALPELTAGEFVSLHRVLKGGVTPERLRRAEVLAQELGVSTWCNRPLQALSFGQRKRTCLLAALWLTPPLLVLDEPSNGLDPDGVELLVKLFKERTDQGLTTLYSTNDAAFLDASATVTYRLQAGKLAAEAAAHAPAPRPLSEA